MGCHPNPIDELHHFSRWLLHHQPELFCCGVSKMAMVFRGISQMVQTQPIVTLELGQKSHTNQNIHIEF
jgi:hypothetical protein